MAKRKSKARRNCAGRTRKGGIKKGYRLKKGQSCPVKV